MQSFKQFIIKKAYFDEQKKIARFHYSFDHGLVSFTEKINLPVAWRREDRDPAYIEMLLFHLSIAIGISYYKLAPTSEIIVEEWYLDDQQKLFWHDFYIQGLGEFFYTNDIDPEGLAIFSSLSEIVHQHQDIPLAERYLVPIGWWKDSIVSIELLKNQIPLEQITLYTHGNLYLIHQSTIFQSGCERIYTQRYLDPLLFQMNHMWYYNGHVPITGIISFVSLFISYLYDFKYILLSNERSANFGNTNWKWIEINHQRSKSKMFEEMFVTYVSNYINPHTRYCSLLRPWYEIRIAQQFSAYKQYFWWFSSCNTNFKIEWDNTQQWCKTCPKCLFVYSILRPFLSLDEVTTIRWEEIYDNIELLELFKELRWVSGFKPFECVGTYDEMSYATWKYIQQQKNNSLELSPVLDWFDEHVSTTKSFEQREDLWNELFTTFNDDMTYIPEHLRSLLV